MLGQQRGIPDIPGSEGSSSSFGVKTFNPGVLCQLWPPAPARVEELQLWSVKSTLNFLNIAKNSQTALRDVQRGSHSTGGSSISLGIGEDPDLLCWWLRKLGQHLQTSLCRGFLGSSVHGCKSSLGRVWALFEESGGAFRTCRCWVGKMRKVRKGKSLS